MNVEPEEKFGMPAVFKRFFDIYDVMTVFHPLTLGYSCLTIRLHAALSHDCSPSPSRFIAPLYHTYFLHGFNHSNGPEQRAISFIAGSQMHSRYLWVKLCQKGNHNVSVPGEFAWLQLNHKEKHFKYSTPPSSVLFSASHTFFSLANSDTPACILLINLQFILNSPESKQGAQSTIQILKLTLMITSE